MVLLSLASCLEMVVGKGNVGMRTWRVGDLGLVAIFEKRWHENLEGRICFVSDLGLVATHFCDKT